MEEKIITSVEFDLCPGEEKKHICGKALFYPDRIEADAGGQKTVTAMPGITSFRCARGVGCVMLEAQTADGYILICRGSMLYDDWFTLAAKRLNRWLSTGKIEDGFSEYVKPVCEKCGRPLPPGSRECPRCRKKGDYLKRLWKMAKPVRPLIYISVVMYFAVSGLGLLVPSLNRILVDNYITKAGIPDWSKYAAVVLMILGVNLVTRVLSILRSCTQTVAGTKIIVKLRNITFERIQAMSLSRISKRTTGELMNRVTEDTRRI
ncbi:MAG: ABC transporter transmembrane domain-containing protein, partial [Clostridia bacterium]|nr:ABC transporter transmembrane domain-containing protein [Clostridia bacterium]